MNMIISNMMTMMRTWQLEVISDRRTVPGDITIWHWLLYLLRTGMIAMLINVGFHLFFCRSLGKGVFERNVLKRFGIIQIVKFKFQTIDS